MPRKPPAVTCAENIALLSALHTVPKPPSKTKRPLPTSTAWPGDYQLSFDDERLIASAFAFLSSISDNPNNVTAVCIQEIQDNHGSGRQESLRILVAMNKRSHGGGQTVLGTIKTGMESVVKPLKWLDKDFREGEGNDTSLQTVENGLFTAIVRMCEKRILCRLRLIPTSRGISKQPLKMTLQLAIESLRRLRNDTNSISNNILDPIVKNMKSVIKLLDAWTQHQVLVRLQELVEGVHRLNEIAGLHSAIRSIPKVDMAPKSCESLVNTVQKVARYRQIARLLYRMAKDTTPILRQTSVVIVDLPTPAYDRVQPNDDYTPNIVAKINEVSKGVAYSKREMNMLFQYLETDREAASQMFEEQTRETLAEAKIHAEIQLAAYCNSSVIQQLPPRVVRSNKDACFLCGIFLQKHSNMYTSRHHGKLYPGWRLPHTLSVSVQKSFNEELANIIRASIATLEARKTKTEYPGRNESTLTSILSLRSRVSLLSMPTQPQNECIRSEVALSVDANEDDPVEDEIDPAMPNKIVQDNPSSDITPPNNDQIHDDLLLGKQALQAESSTRLTANKSPVEPISREPELLSGTIPHTSPTTSVLPDEVEPVSRPPSLSLSGQVQHGQTSALLNLPPFEIQFDYATDTFSRAAETMDLDFALYQLLPYEVDKLQREKVEVVNIEKQCFGDEVVYALDNMDCLYIAGQGSFLRISLGFPAAR